MLTDSDKERLETIWFTPQRFGDMFPLLNAVYKRFGFTDPISDERRISEFSDITKEYRKYISKTKTIIMKDLEQRGWDAAYETAKHLQASQQDKATDRAGLAYNYIRDSWMMGLIDDLRLGPIVEDEEENYLGGIDGWTE